ncbi:sensor histidine kinase [Streptomyces sp. NPDC090442]|uniref:sensor histidine kinase n=1 Tax=Streptomyces sp. NPDC090442 TaxID=3365962 RepID=UPI0037F11EA1
MSRIAIPRLTIRARLTLLYGGLFTLSSAVLLAIVYLLLDRTLPERLDVVALQYHADGSASLSQDGGSAAPSAGSTGLATSLRDTALSSLLQQGGIALALLTALAMALGYVMAGRVVRPLHQISDTASRISRNSLGQRLAFSGPRDEVKDLADTFDAMLDKLARSFDDQERFIADASHELRTPLAVNQTLIEVALRKKDASDDARRLGESLLIVNSRNERLIDGLLALAKGDREIHHHSPADLQDIAERVAGQRAQEAAVAGVELRVAAEPAQVSGDPVMLEQLMHNLVENAIRYNKPGGWVSVTTARQDDHALVVVANTGPPVPGYQTEALFQPFQRLQTERPGTVHGSGLGLAIVRNIAHTHGGQAQAQSRAGGGLVITVHLPTTRFRTCYGQVPGHQEAPRTYGP